MDGVASSTGSHHDALQLNSARSSAASAAISSGVRTRRAASRSSFSPELQCITAVVCTVGHQLAACRQHSTTTGLSQTARQL